MVFFNHDFHSSAKFKFSVKIIFSCGSFCKYSDYINNFKRNFNSTKHKRNMRNYKMNQYFLENGINPSIVYPNFDTYFLIIANKMYSLQKHLWDYFQIQNLMFILEQYIKFRWLVILSGKRWRMDTWSPRKSWSRIYLLLERYSTYQFSFSCIKGQPLFERIEIRSPSQKHVSRIVH